MMYDYNMNLFISRTPTTTSFVPVWRLWVPLLEELNLYILTHLMKPWDYQQGSVPVLLEIHRSYSRRSQVLQR